MFDHDGLGYWRFLRVGIRRIPRSPHTRRQDFLRKTPRDLHAEFEIENRNLCYDGVINIKDLRNFYELIGVVADAQCEVVRGALRGPVL